MNLFLLIWLRAGNSYPEGSTRVDRRPKNIVVTGFNSEEADFVLGHFKHFGETTKHDIDLEKPQRQTIASPVYKEATTAELNKTNQPQEATTAAISSPNPSQYNSETEATATDTLPELRLENEEKDEESEDKTNKSHAKRKQHSLRYRL
uniref:RRM domain-containing protein n=1 Tax=Glossina palpalis gambiensis TaxID=67801 RepID=A0A1B0C248_9MUSC